MVTPLPHHLSDHKNYLQSWNVYLNKANWKSFFRSALEILKPVFFSKSKSNEFLQEEATTQSRLKLVSTFLLWNLWNNGPWMHVAITSYIQYLNFWSAQMFLTVTTCIDDYQWTILQNNGLWRKFFTIKVTLVKFKIIYLKRLKPFKTWTSRNSRTKLDKISTKLFGCLWLFSWGRSSRSRASYLSFEHGYSQ